ncbi:MAG: ParA family protein [Flavobacteriaceae bacterium]|nr:ParA family protein [Flavobacteriaceae bacterium]
MIVAIANQKGGVGKTTLAILLSNYLFDKGKDFIAVDFDFQESFYSKWQEESSLLEEEPPYEVLQEPLQKSNKILNLANENKDVIFLLDLPGKLDDDCLIPILKSVDLILIPFNYDKLIFKSTLFFCQVVQAINPNIKTLFIPNRVKGTVKYNTKEQVSKALKNFGEITPQITDRISIGRISVYGNSKEISSICEDTFNFINNYL